MDPNPDRTEQSDEAPFEQPVTEYDRIMAQFKVSARRLPRYGRLAANMLRDDRVPPEARGALVVGGAYVISPIDLIPGFIPVLGQLDDLLVALLGLRFALAQSAPEVRVEHLERAGLRDEDFAEDLRTVRDTTIYMLKAVARRTVHGVGADGSFRWARVAARNRPGHPSYLKRSLSGCVYWAPWAVSDVQSPSPNAG